jgi:hypothetical protein
LSKEETASVAAPAARLTTKKVKIIPIAKSRIPLLNMVPPGFAQLMLINTLLRGWLEMN